MKTMFLTILLALTSTSAFAGKLSCAELKGKLEVVGDQKICRTPLFDIFYEPKANGIRLNTDSNYTGLCLYFGKKFGAVNNSDDTGGKIAGTIEVNKFGQVDEFNPEQKKRVLDSIACYNYEQPKKRK